MAKPTDDEILAALRSGGRCMTYVVANILRRRFHPLKTDFVLRRLRALEGEGKVVRVPSSYAVQYCWVAAASPNQSSSPDGEGGKHGN